MGIKVLSLCDGMSCGQIALEKLNIEVDKYYASEIKQNAIKVTQDNFPNTIHIGDVNKIQYENGVLITENGDYATDIDLVIFGSPCQSFSVAMKTENRIGLQNKEKSGLFLECYRILQEIKPKFFLMENVASMKKEDKEYISRLMGVKPILYNSSDIAPMMRKRLYWTNIPQSDLKIKNIKLADVLNAGYCDRDKARTLLVSDSRPLSTPIKMFHRYYSTGFTTLIFKNKQHYDDCCTEYNCIKNGKNKIKASELDSYTGNVFNGVRYMNQDEMEKCQTVPNGYTKILTRNESADVLGDGWTIDVIAHVLSYLENKY